MEAYLAGQDSAESSQEAYIAGGLTAQDSQEAYLTGGLLASSSVETYLAGKADIDDSREAYLAGGLAAAGSAEAYIDGVGFASSSAQAYMNVRPIPDVFSSASAFIAGAGPPPAPTGTVEGLPYTEELYDELYAKWISEGRPAQFEQLGEFGGRLWSVLNWNTDYPTFMLQASDGPTLDRDSGLVDGYNMNMPKDGGMKISRTATGKYVIKGPKRPRN